MHVPLVIVAFAYGVTGINMIVLVLMKQWFESLQLNLNSDEGRAQVRTNYTIFMTFEGLYEMFV
jgi:hypothetical protein